MDLTGNEIREVSHINAVELDSVYFSGSGDSIILGGKGAIVNEVGFYKLDIESGEMSILLNEEQLRKDNKVRLSKPYIPLLSYDEKNIYFIAITDGTPEKNFLGITTYPNAIYCYNLQEKRLNEVFKISNAFIPSVSFTYQ